jgi:hypothetical protein
MKEETASAKLAGKGEIAIIAHVEPLLREEMRRDSLTEKTAEELIKRLVEDHHSARVNRTRKMMWRKKRKVAMMMVMEEVMAVVTIRRVLCSPHKEAEK